jgi:hypothetical protein
MLNNKKHTLELTKSYWINVVCSLECWTDHLRKELKVIEKVLPNSNAYWTLRSQMEDSEQVAKEVRKFVDYVVLVDD